MTKAEYMEMLQQRLERFSNELQEEILEDYRQHFAEGEAEGKSEEELIAELGDIEDMICELPEEAQDAVGMGNEVKLQGNTLPVVSGAGNGNRAREGNFVYEGIYPAVVLDGRISTMLVEESPDDKIYVEYRDNSEVQYHEYYQYVQDGVFYAGFRRIEGMYEQNENRGGLFDRIFATIMSMQNNGISVKQEITFKVKLPKGLDTIHVKSSSGRIEVKGLVTKLLKVEGGSGRLMLDNLQAETIKCGNGSGRISLHEIIAQNVKCGTGSGRIEGDGLKVETLNGSTGSGSIQVSTMARDIKMGTGSGRIEVTCGGALEQASFSTGSGSVRVCLRDLTGMEAKLVSGSGRTVVNWKGQSTNCRNKTCSFGDGSCKVKASTGSGGVEVIVE